MKKIFLFPIPVIMALLPFVNSGIGHPSAICIPPDTVINYMHTDTIINYDNRVYRLAWSSHPASTYYVQEYVPDGESVDHYKSMLFIDFLMVDTPAASVVELKINEIEKKKKLDMYTAYQLQVNQAKGEYLLDFTISDGNFVSLNIVEFDAYRYINYTDKKGHKGVLLFAISKRAYGGDITPFLPKLRDEMAGTLKTHTEFKIPPIEIN